MKDRKLELLDYALYDYQYLQRHLQEKAAEGWQLEKISTFGILHYRRREPADIRYEVTYAPSASAYNSRPTESEEALSDLCAEAGWVKVASIAQLHIYSNTDPKATPIETDELTRIETLKAAMNRHFVPGQLLMVGLFVLQFLMQVSNVRRWPLTTLSSNMMLCMLFFFPCTALSFLAMVLGYYHWVRRAERAAERGEPVPECLFYRRFRFVLWALIACYAATLLLSAGFGIIAVVIIIAAVTFGVTGFTMTATKSMGAPKWANILVPFVTAFVILMVLMPLLMGWLDAASLQENPVVPEDLPLVLSDLTEVQDSDPMVDESTSILLSHTRYSEWSEDLGILGYTIVDVHFDPVYELCLNYQEKQFLNSASWIVADVLGNQGQLWGADYARKATETSRDRWFICWEDRIVTLTVPFPMTDEQIAIAAEALRP